MLVDTHAHLSFPQLLKERKDVIARSIEAGVIRIVDVGTNLDMSRAAVEGAHKYPSVYASAGFHPHDSEVADEAGMKVVQDLLREERVVAVGETGLDFYRDYAPHDLQESLFRGHVELALETGLPLILHSRGAEDRVIEILDETGAGRVGGVLHCFGGTTRQAIAAIEIGFHVGLGGTVTFKNSGSMEVALGIPRDRLVLETDCPYLAPVPHRGKRNEPAYVYDIASSIAERAETTVDAIAGETTRNAERLFKLEA